VPAGLRLTDQLPPLAEAKLAAPRQRRGLVPRPRLEHALEGGADAALTLVAAPAGYGKTTAVRAWAEHSGGALAWVTLDAGDNEPARLWTYVATAVDRIRNGLGRRAINRLRASATGVEVAVDEVMNGIAEFGQPFTLVLDDLQTVTDRECLASLDYAIERLPPSARLIVITRADPALGLARLRGRGALSEVRAADLAFTPTEARELLVDRAGLELDDEQIGILRKRTEGWPAALYLAALWLRSVEDRGQAVLEFGGEHRYVAEYLSHEVLASLDPARRSFLLRAAVLGSFTAELCDAVLDRSDSAAVLGELEESNMFVLSLERREWFRVHALFAEFAAAQLGAVEPTIPQAIHRRAAAWLRSQGLVVEAVQHAAAAGDLEVVAELLSEYHLPLIRNGRSGTLLRWAQVLPDEILIEHPDAAVGAATAALLVGRMTRERRRFLRLAARARVQNPERFGTYEECVSAMVRSAGLDDGVSDAVVEGYRAVELAQRGADETLVAALSSLGRALYFAGELDGARGAASRAVAHPDTARRAPGVAVAHAVLTLVAVDRGRLASAREHAEAARALVGRVTSSRTWLGSTVAEALGAVLAAEGDLLGAEREFSFAERFLEDDVATLPHARLLIRLAGVRCRRGRLDDAEDALRRAREELDELGDSGAVPLFADEAASEIEQARLHAGHGEILDVPSEAELAVLRLLASDLSAREIGAQLFLSPNTVRSHIRSIYRKLGVGSREDAVARAETIGLVERNHPGDQSLTA
jgi:LuxR family transcriptional regulator, maltose regulon positive regulatory protein